MDFVLRITKGKFPLKVEAIDSKGCSALARRFPLDRNGCIAAGKLLFDIGAEHWRCSSSVDFPADIVPRCRLDVRNLVADGYHAAFNSAMKPRLDMITKAMKFLYASEEFTAALSEKEKAAWDEMYNEHMSKLKNGKKSSRSRKTRS